MGQNQPPVPLDVTAKPEPLVLQDGRRLWRFRTERIPVAAVDVRCAAIDEARRPGCVLVADGLDLILVEPWLSELSDDMRTDLAANAGKVIALLRRGEPTPCR